MEGHYSAMQERCGDLQGTLETMVAGALDSRATLTRPAGCVPLLPASTPAGLGVGSVAARWVGLMTDQSHWRAASHMLSVLTADRDPAAFGECHQWQGLNRGRSAHT